jgi:hypothetical protein
LTGEALCFDYEQGDIAILDCLVDLPSHQSVQRAFRAPRMARRIDEHGLISAFVQNAENALARGVRFVGNDAELLADQRIQQR